MSVIYTLAVCAIIFLIAIEFVLSRILSRLDKIHTTLDLIHQDLVKVLVPSTFTEKPHKNRIYWIDPAGFKHWRKNND